MKVWPFGVALRGEAPNHRVLRWLKTVVVSDAEKAQVMRQVGIRKTVRSLEVEIAVEVSLPKSRGHQNRDVWWVVPGRARRVPADWPGGVRHVGDVILVCCSRTEREKACPGTASAVWGREGASRAG